MDNIIWKVDLSSFTHRGGPLCKIYIEVLTHCMGFEWPHIAILCIGKNYVFFLCVGIDLKGSNLRTAEILGHLPAHGRSYSILNVPKLWNLHLLAIFFSFFLCWTAGWW